MPSTSAKQHRFMAAIAHSPSFAKKVGVSQSVGKDFNAADKGKTFNKGGMMKESKGMIRKEMAFMKNKGAPKSMIKHEKAEMMGMKKGGMPMKDGKPAFMNKFAKGGSIRRMADGGMTAPMAPPMAPQAPVDPRQMAAMQAAMQAQGGAPMAPGMKRGGSVGFAKGGGIESRGKTKGTMVRMATGGSVSSASRRADGIAQRGKTKC
jgi:hypothetical protein